LGVYGLFSERPIKIDGIPAEGPDGAEGFSDWQLVYQPAEGLIVPGEDHDDVK
jgi:hypothetical protein